MDIDYRNCKNIIATDENGYTYKINIENYIRGKQPHKFMRNPYAYENLQQFFELTYPHLELLNTEYSGIKSNVSFICKYHRDKGVQNRKLDNMINSNRQCHYCTIELNNKRISDDLIKARCNDLALNYIDRKIVDGGTVVLFTCDKHIDKGIQSITWDHLRTCSFGCSYCAGKHWTTDDLIKYIAKINSSVEIIGEYNGLYKKIQCSCKSCGNMWRTTPASLKNGAGCPKCSSSHGERIIHDFLMKNQIQFYTQYSFPQCKNKQPLKFDFYIPSKNTVIEYDGQQHYFPVDFSGKGKLWAEKQFEKNRLRDQIKNDFCKKREIKLIRIPYYEVCNINKILALEL